MEGVNILATIVVDDISGWFGPLLLGTIIFLVIGLFLLGDGADGYLVSALLVIGILFGIGAFTLGIEKETTYKATIDDTVPLRAIEEKYIIVDKTDDLYTLKLKETEDE